MVTIYTEIIFEEMPYHENIKVVPIGKNNEDWCIKMCIIAKKT